MRVAVRLVLGLLAALLAAGSLPAAETRANPFFAKSTLTYETPPFDKIQDSDYGPALEEGMKRQIAEIEKIADDSAPPTFENTLVAM